MEIYKSYVNLSLQEYEELKEEIINLRAENLEIDKLLKDKYKTIVVKNSTFYKPSIILTNDASVLHIGEELSKKAQTIKLLKKELEKIKSRSFSQKLKDLFKN